MNSDDFEGVDMGYPTLLHTAGCKRLLLLLKDAQEAAAVVDQERRCILVEQQEGWEKTIGRLVQRLVAEMYVNAPMTRTPGEGDAGFERDGTAASRPVTEDDEA